MTQFSPFRPESVSICRTCPRDTPQSGQVGLALMRSVQQRLEKAGIDILMVNCLGVCSQPCAVALDAPTKYRLRFSMLSPEDADLLIEAVNAYVASSNGSLVGEAPLPFLMSRLSAVSPKLVLVPSSTVSIPCLTGSPS